MRYKNILWMLSLCFASNVLAQNTTIDGNVKFSGLSYYTTPLHARYFIAIDNQGNLEKKDAFYGGYTLNYQNDILSITNPNGSSSSVPDISQLAIDNMGNHTAIQDLDMNNKDIDANINKITFTNSKAIEFSASGSSIGTAKVNAKLSIGRPYYQVVPTTTYMDGTYDLDVDGDIKCTSHAAASDIRLKENITQLHNVLDKVIQVKGYSYQFDKDNYPQFSKQTGTKFGVIAQEVKEVFPSIVHTESTNFYAVNYVELIPLLLQAIKEQQVLIENQGGQLDAIFQEQKNFSNIAADLISDEIAYIGIEIVLNYSLPTEISDGVILIKSLSGSKKLEYKVTNSGQLVVNLEKSGLIPGMYDYSLLVNDKEVCNKKIVLINN